MESNVSTKRRDLLKLMGLGGVVFASSLGRGLVACSGSTGATNSGAAPTTDR